MAHRDSQTTTIDQQARAGWTAYARAAWPRVHIDLVETTPLATGCRVRAVVDLDRLTPADVVVGLTPGSPGGAIACPSDCRMWSTESYDNGRFVFERVIPPAESLAGTDWAVCVCPAGGLTGRPVASPLRLDAACPARRHARPHPDS